MALMDRQSQRVGAVARWNVVGWLALMPMLQKKQSSLIVEVGLVEGLALYRIERVVDQRQESNRHGW
jgi:hypothetical protein